MIGGVQRTVVNRRRRLVLDDKIEIRLGDLALRRHKSSRLVVGSLRVSNLGDRRLRWPVSVGQVALWIDERLIPQDRRGRSLALEAVGPGQKPRVELAAGQSSTVTVGWRISPAAAARLESRGSSIIVVPPHADARSVDVATRIGVLRLWR